MKRSLTAWITGIALVATLAACSDAEEPTADPTQTDETTETTDGDEPVHVTVGVNGISHDHWRIFEDLAAEAGIEVELVNFTDFNQPNPITSRGELDLNQFQHLQYLANYNISANDDLQPIGSTAIYQLALYTERDYTTPDDIPEGAEIAIPNDVVNQARALLVLQSAGLIELTDGGNALSTPAEIDPDASRVVVVPVDANQTAVQLRSLDAAVINNSFTADAGIDPTSAIYSDLQDTATARPYLNVWVTRADDVDNPVYNQLVEIYHSPEVIEQLLRQNTGTAVAENIDAAELQQDLADLEDLIRASQG